MTRALLVSVRFHDGRYHGAGDWPPSPARLFQALVAAAALPSLDGEKRRALEWLERQPAPTIAAPAMHGGQNVNLFVPNNDMDASKVGGDLRKIGKIRTTIKQIRPRLFDAAVPLLYLWRFAGDENHAEKIFQIANNLYQLGRGVDMAWAVGELVDEETAEEQLRDYPGAVYRPSHAGPGLDCPIEGSLVSLKERHEAMAKRFRHIWSERKLRTLFANAPKPCFRSVVYNSPAKNLLFELRRITATNAPFAPWEMHNTATLVRTVRDKAYARLEPHLGHAIVEKVFVGRNATQADKALRIRIVPLPSVGHPYADRGIRRVLVEVPPNCPIRVDDIESAFSGLTTASHEIDPETGEITSDDYWMEQLVPASDNTMLRHYGVAEGNAYRKWRSVTPLALPADAKRRRIDLYKRRDEAKVGKERDYEQRRACHAVTQALRHAGLREKAVELRVQREPFYAKGERAEAFAAGTRFSSRQLWHVEIDFANAVHGPLVLGNGRYAGLGLMAPVQQVEGVLAFNIVNGLATHAELLQLARALRRAVMARVQKEIGSKKKIDLFFSGHEDDGSTARRGGHAHLAFVTDLARHRLLVIAPHEIEHRAATDVESSHLKILMRALTNLKVLRAGHAGKLELEKAGISPNTDPVFAASAVWRTATPYTPTRHAKRNGRDSLYDDLMQEVQRRQLPVPLAVERSGTGVLLRFKVAVRGPILLGKTMHFGGGLFVGEDKEESDM